MRATGDRVGRFFIISRSIRASASSLRSLVTSASSSGTEREPGAALGDVPHFAATTQLANVPLGIVSRCAVSSSVSPCARTSFTASSRSSGVYVFERFICPPVGEVYQTGVSEKVRVPQSAARERKQITLEISATYIRDQMKPPR
jgi:hypothetical protein